MSIITTARCYECGDELEIQNARIDDSKSDDNILIEVSTCQHCMEEQYNTGKEEGMLEERSSINGE